MIFPTRCFPFDTSADGMQKATIGIFRGIRSIAFGHWSHTVSGPTIERDSDEGDTVEISYEVTKGTVLSSQPEQDTVTPV